MSLAILLSVALLVDGTLAHSESARTLAFKRHLTTNLAGTGKTLAQVERERIAYLAESLTGGKEKRWKKPHHKSKTTYKNTVPASSLGVAYTASVGVGCPPTEYNLFIDSGSSNIWIGHHTPYVPTESSYPTGSNFSITYGDGTVNGPEYLEKITLSPSLIVNNQSIGVDDHTGNFITHGNITLDGIIGIGPVSSTVGSIVGQPNATVPTVTNNLLAQGQIKQELVGVYYAPYGSANHGAGELAFGQADPSKYIGNITYTSSQTGSWYISNSMAVGNSTFLTGSGLVDTGTILIYMAIDEFESYMINSGGSYDQSLNMISVTKEQQAALAPLIVTVEGQKFTLNADAQTWPVELNELIGLPKDKIYLIVSTYGNTFPFQFIMGLTFMERFYTVFDTQNSRIGFAPTAHTYDVVNYKP